jgi:hypothetical protein
MAGAHANYPPTMKTIPIPALALSLFAGAAAAAVGHAWAGGDLAALPEAVESGVRDATVTRGTLRQESVAGRETVEAVTYGGPAPSGTVVTLVAGSDNNATASGRSSPSTPTAR